MATGASQGAAYAPVTQALGPDEENHVEIKTKPGGAHHQPGPFGLSRQTWIVIAVVIFLVAIAIIIGVVVALSSGGPTELAKQSTTKAPSTPKTVPEVTTSAKGAATTVVLTTMPPEPGYFTGVLTLDLVFTYVYADSWSGEYLSLQNGIQDAIEALYDTAPSDVQMYYNTTTVDTFLQNTTILDAKFTVTAFGIDRGVRDYLEEGNKLMTLDIPHTVLYAVLQPEAKGSPHAATDEPDIQA